MSHAFKPPVVRAARVWCVGAMLLAPAIALTADDDWSIQFSLGSAYSFPSRIEIEQAGGREIGPDAQYETRPFDDSPYYSYRIGRWRDGRAWEIELIHHKLYVKDPPAPVEHFEITHGFNIVVGGRAFEISGWIVRAGAGIVLAHAETRIAGVSHDSGYEIAGPALAGAVERRFSLNRHFFLACEGKLTIGWARVSVDRGRARLANTALHAVAGVGARF